MTIKAEKETIYNEEQIKKIINSHYESASAAQKKVVGNWERNFKLYTQNYVGSVFGNLFEAQSNLVTQAVDLLVEQNKDVQVPVLTLLVDKEKQSDELLKKGDNELLVTSDPEQERSEKEKELNGVLLKIFDDNTFETARETELRNALIKNFCARKIYIDKGKVIIDFLPSTHVIVTPFARGYDLNGRSNDYTCHRQINLPLSSLNGNENYDPRVVKKLFNDLKKDKKNDKYKEFENSINDNSQDGSYGDTPLPETKWLERDDPLYLEFGEKIVELREHYVRLPDRKGNLKWFLFTSTEQPEELSDRDKNESYILRNEKVEDFLGVDMNPIILWEINADESNLYGNSQVDKIASLAIQQGKIVSQQITATEINNLAMSWANSEEEHLKGNLVPKPFGLYFVSDVDSVKRMEQVHVPENFVLMEKFINEAKSTLGVYPQLEGGVQKGDQTAREFTRLLDEAKKRVRGLQVPLYNVNKDTVEKVLLLLQYSAGKINDIRIVSGKEYKTFVPKEFFKTESSDGFNDIYYVQTQSQRVKDALTTNAVEAYQALLQVKPNSSVVFEEWAKKLLSIVNENAETIDRVLSENAQQTQEQNELIQAQQALELERQVGEINNLPQPPAQGQQ